MSGSEGKLTGLSFHKFTWNEDKNSTNVRKHGIDFSDVTAAFSGPLLVRRSDRGEEKRFVAVGLRVCPRVSGWN
jgi:uncharacterized protein